MQLLRWNGFFQVAGLWHFGKSKWALMFFGWISLSVLLSVLADFVKRRISDYCFAVNQRDDVQLSAAVADLHCANHSFVTAKPSLGCCFALNDLELHHTRLATTKWHETRVKRCSRSSPFKSVHCISMMDVDGNGSTAIAPGTIHMDKALMDPPWTANNSRWAYEIFQEETEIGISGVNYFNLPYIGNCWWLWRSCPRARRERKTVKNNSARVSASIFDSRDLSSNLTFCPFCEVWCMSTVWEHEIRWNREKIRTE